MDSELQKLIRQLQDQKCPPAVLDRVAQRISREKASARSRRFSLAWALSLACFLVVAFLWQWQSRQQAQRVAAELAAAQVRADRAAVVQQTHQAFAYIGQALLRAAAHTESALSKDAAPQLRNGFEIVKNKVTKPI